MSNIKVLVNRACHIGKHKIPATVELDGQTMKTCALLPEGPQVRALINRHCLRVAPRDLAINLDLANEQHGSKSKSRD